MRSNPNLFQLRSLNNWQQIFQSLKRVYKSIKKLNNGHVQEAKILNPNYCFESACNAASPVIETGDAEDEDGAEDVDGVHHGQAEHQLVEVTLHHLTITTQYHLSLFIMTLCKMSPEYPQLTLLWTEPSPVSSVINHLLVEPNNAEEIANDASNPDQNLDIGN